MATLTQKEIFDSLIKNELNYKNASDENSKRTFYNWGYIGIGYLVKHYDLKSIYPDLQRLINNSTLYSSIFTLYTKNDNRSYNRNDNVAVEVLLSKLDSIVSELKALLNTH